MVGTETIRVEIPCSGEYVSVPRKTVEGLAKRIGLNLQETQDLQLAVGEACTNAVKYSEKSNPTVSVLYTVSNDRLEIQVRNRGAAFDRAKCQGIPEERIEQGEGGLGLYLIDRVMDELNVICDGGETCVKMVKILHKT